MPGALAYKWFAVKQISSFFLCGTTTEISLTSKRTSSSAAFDSTAWLFGLPFACCSAPNFLFFCAGSPFSCNRS